MPTDLENVEYTILHQAFSSDDSGKRKEFNKWCMRFIDGCTYTILQKLWKDKLLMVNGWKDVRLTRTGTARFYQLHDLKGITRVWNWGETVSQSISKPEGKTK